MQATYIGLGGDNSRHDTHDSVQANRDTITSATMG